MREADALGRNVFFQLRLPRVLLGALAGAVLGVSGTLMQGLFRNPIVEPGLAGTSAGAALGASLVFVLGGGTGALAFSAPLGAFAVPVLAFAGAFGATILVYRISSSFGKVNVFTLLLAGIAVNAVCGAGRAFSRTSRAIRRRATSPSGASAPSRPQTGAASRSSAVVLRRVLRDRARLREAAQRADARRGRGGVLGADPRRLICGCSW